MPTVRVRQAYLLSVFTGAVIAGDGIGQGAYAHGIAGNRYFPGTLTFDDPAVADEWPTEVSSFKHPAGDGTDVTDKEVTSAFSRLLTPTLLVGIDTGWTERSRGGFPSQAGPDVTNLNLKTLVYENDPHETLISASFAWGIAYSGSRAIGADRAATLQPGLFFGRGFGDFPDSISWLRPFAIAGAVTPEFATSHTSTVSAATPGEQSAPVLTTRTPNIFHWGLALEFSTLYLTDRFTGGQPKEEPLHQFVPLVEFPFDTPFGAGSNGRTVATMNPGLSYVADTWQLAVAAIVPLNREAGRGVGIRAQVLFFLDDLVPALFGQPLLSH